MKLEQQCVSLVRKLSKHANDEGFELVGITIKNPYKDQVGEKMRVLGMDVEVEQSLINPKEL